MDAGADDGAALRRRARSAAGTSPPAGAKMIAASSGSGGGSRVAGPLGAELARERLAGASPARVKAKTRRPWWRATCATMCAAAPKP